MKRERYVVLVVHSLEDLPRMYEFRNSRMTGCLPVFDTEEDAKQEYPMCEVVRVEIEK